MFKYFFATIVVAWITTSCVQAQTTDTSVADAINYAFAPLEKNRVPHGILLDYGLDFVALDKYNGVSQKNNYIQPSLYRSIYNTVVSSAIQTGVAGIHNPKQKYQEWKTLQEQETEKNSLTVTHLVLSGLYFKYSKIRENALDQGDIRVINGSTQYNDVYSNGTWQNPYETKEVIAFSTRVLEVQTHSVKISLPTSLWFTNQSTQIDQIEIDFNNGLGRQDISGGRELNYANTSSIGYKTWDFYITLTNGTLLTSRMKIKFNKIRGGISNRVESDCTEDREKIVASRPYLGRNGGAILQIVYGSSDCRLRNPLIVAEGLDTGLQAASGSIGDTDINSFFASVDDSNSFELRNLITNDTNIDYDVVYVNWGNGTDYLQRNAFVLQDVIKWVNANKVTNTPNVILGQSMGGLITRYALRDMENRGEAHDTNLFVSHDAPHQGAHIPLGVQYMARHFIDRFISTPLSGFELDITDGGASVEDLRNLLEAPGVKQLVDNYVNSSFAVDNTAFDTFQNELRGLGNQGYPQLTRNVAISNGSHCGNPQKIQPGDRIFTLNGGAKTGWLTDILLTINPLFNTFVSTFLTVLVADAGFLLGILPGNSRLSIDVRANAYPTSGSREVYYGRVRYTKKLLWLIDINKTITERSFNSQPGILPIETYPGGVNPIFEDDFNLTEVDNAFGQVGFDVTFNADFSFIPVASALDVGGGNVTLNASDYNRTYTVSNPPGGSRAIPFVNFTSSFNTENISEPHITFNALNGNWLAEELDRDAIRDSFDCQNITIDGPSQICGASTYSVPAGANNYIWSSPNSSVTFSGNGTSAVSVNVGSGNSFTLNVDIVSDCNTIRFSREVLNGAPRIQTNPVPDICVGAIIPDEEFLLPETAGAQQYRLVSDSANLLIELQNEITFSGNAIFPIPIIFSATRAGTYNVRLYVTNSCATSQTILTVVAKSSNQCGGGPFLVENSVLYPNPATDQVTLRLNKFIVENKKETSFLKVNTIAITNTSGIVYRNIPVSNKTDKQVLSLQGLQPDLYFVLINTSQGTFTEKLIIE